MKSDFGEYMIKLKSKKNLWVDVKWKNVCLKINLKKYVPNRDTSCRKQKENLQPRSLSIPYSIWVPFKLFWHSAPKTIIFSAFQANWMGIIQNYCVRLTIHLFFSLKILSRNTYNF